MKRLFFFAQLFIGGAIASHSLSMTQEDAEQHLAELKQGENVKSAYMCTIDFI